MDRDIKKILRKQKKFDNLQKLHDRKLVDFCNLQKQIAIDNNLLDTYNSIIPHRIPCNNQTDNQTDNQTNNQTNNQTDKIINNLYKQLALQTHPDKVNSNGEDFIKLDNYYKTNNLGGVLLMALDYGIDFKEISDEETMEIYLEKSLYYLDKKINNIKKSVIYPFMMDDAEYIEKYKDEFALSLKLQNEGIQIFKTFR